MLAYPLKTVSIGALRDFIQEWQSPNFHSLAVQPFIWLLLSTFAAVGISQNRLALSDFLLTAGFAYLGLLSGRNLALFSLAAPPVLTRYAAPVINSFARRIGFNKSLDVISGVRMARLNNVLLSLVFLAVAVKASLVVSNSVNEQAFQKFLPIGAVEHIRSENYQRNLFNSYNWGGYLLWALPDYPVFIDGRTDLYNDEIINQWLKVVRAEENWQQVLENWDVKLVLLERDYPIAKTLVTAGWKKVYEDDQAVVLIR
jgi:hypothetical protein